jgi:signal transduction histidine kinase
MVKDMGAQPSLSVAITLSSMNSMVPSVKTVDRMPREVAVRTLSLGENRIAIQVKDNGINIPPENLIRIFSHGFTTKKDGHGFGLHSGALAAEQLGGLLTAESEGPNRGATFTLQLPITGKTVDIQGCAL